MLMSDAWRRFLQAYQLSINDDEFALSSIRELFPCTIAGIMHGNNDSLRAHRVVVEIEYAIESFDGSYLLHIKDETGSMQAIIAREDAAGCLSAVEVGSVLVIEKAAIFVDRSGSVAVGGRKAVPYLSIIRKHIIAVFPADITSTAST